ncbi:MAG: ABC transporter permease [Verrucomicrobiales bacterium]|nr:ABC transporter permease [Verrucomicrobiales bacterium]|tara:strand:- start:475 stop:1326 length:852 start_codon:yes stop_codon:yes gene_type:complete
MEVFIAPQTWWIDPFISNGFMRNALVAGLLAVLTTSVVGTWVVLRGVTFLGDALAHGVLPGVAVAFVVGMDPTLGAFVAAIAMVGGINLLREHSSLPEDASIGVLFVGFLALAVVIMSGHSGSYVGDLNRFLFGSITGVNSDDLRRQAIAAAISLAGVIVFYRAFLVMTFDEVQARMLRLRPQLSHFVLLVLLSISVVASFETVGSLLVLGFLIAPPATATLLVRGVPRIMGVATLLGALSVVVGLLISYHNATAASATMTLVAVVIFLSTVAVRAIWNSVRN